MELDIFGGWTGSIASGVTADVGLLYYAYPNGKVGKAEYFEPYASLSTTFGPASAKVGVAYAWSQDALGGGDNVYLYTDWGVGIPSTPVSLSAHLGYASGVQSPKLLDRRGHRRRPRLFDRGKRQYHQKPVAGRELHRQRRQFDRRFL